MRRMSFVLALASTLAAGCSGSSMNGADQGGGPDLTVSTAVAWTTNVTDLQSQAALSGVQVCIAPDNQICATTDSSGNATFMAPLNAQFMLSYTQSGYAPQYTEHTSTNIANGNRYLLISTAIRGALVGAVGQSLDPTKGNIIMSAIDGATNPMPLSGVTFAATPTAGTGPYYFNGSLPDSNAKSTSSNGLGFILNVPPADYSVTAALTGKSCAGSLNKSWIDTPATNVKVRTIAGALTTVSIVCM